MLMNWLDFHIAIQSLPYSTRHNQWLLTKAGRAGIHSPGMRDEQDNWSGPHQPGDSLITQHREPEDYLT